jgi:hypothetical protein
MRTPHFGSFEGKLGLLHVQQTSTFVNTLIFASFYKMFDRFAQFFYVFRELVP